MDDWREVWSFENIEAVQEAAAVALQDLGISVPRDRLQDIENVSPSTLEIHRGRRSFPNVMFHSFWLQQDPTSHGAFFGVSLECGWQPTLAYCYGEYGDFQLPR